VFHREVIESGTRVTQHMDRAALKPYFQTGHGDCEGSST
jgi:hypothetical protein